MKKVRGHWRLGLLAAFLLLALAPALNSLAKPFGAPTAHADQNIDKLCELPNRNGLFTSKFFTITIIDRADMQITYNGGSGNCSAPPGLPITQLSPNFLWTQFFGDNFIVTDSNADDGYSYGHCIGNKCSDDTQLIRFNEAAIASTKDVFGTHTGEVSTTTISNFLSPAEFFIDIESSQLSGSGVSCSNGANAEFSNAGNGFGWFCNGDSATSGGNHGILLRNLIDPSTLDNFNITYTYDGTSINNVFQQTNSPKSFFWCTTLSPNQFRNDGCNGNLSLYTSSGPHGLNPLTPTDLANLGANSLNVVMQAVDGPNQGKLQSIRVAGPDSQANQLGGGVSNSPAPKATPNSTCQIEGGWGWVLCPFIQTVNGFFHWLEGGVVTLLQTGALTQHGQPQIYAVWSSLRQLSDVFFVIIFLVIIFSNTLSIGLDNYAIKKMLPRLVAAAILVQFSWVLMQLAVDITNILGAGTSGIISAAIKTAPVGGPSASFNAATGGILAGLGVGIGGAIAISIGLIIPVLLVLLSAVISVLGVFITLVIRRLILAVLIVIAPLALMAWVLPNTESMFKTWWKMLLRLLLMYPLIVLIFALAGVANSLGNGSFGGSASQTLNGFVTAILPTLAFFAVPWTFKWAGGAMAAVGGYVTAKASGLSSAARSPAKKRWNEFNAERAKTSLAKRQIKAGDLYSQGGFSRLRSRGMMAGASTSRLAEMSRKAQEDQVKAERNKLALQLDNGFKNDSDFDKGAHLLAAASDGSDYQKQAAMQMMLDRGDIPELNELARDGSVDKSIAWDRAKSEKWSDFSDKAGYLLEGGKLDQKLDKFASKISKAQMATQKKDALSTMLEYGARLKTDTSPSATGVAGQTVADNITRLSDIAGQLHADPRLMNTVRGEEAGLVESIEKI